MVERWKSNYPFGIKLKMLIQRLLLQKNHITEEVIKRKEVLFVADLNRLYDELVNALVDDDGPDVSYITAWTKNELPSQSDLTC